jgi:hypothetical protein
MSFQSRLARQGSTGRSASRRLHWRTPSISASPLPVRKSPTFRRRDRTTSVCVIRNRIAAHVVCIRSHRERHRPSVSERIVARMLRSRWRRSCWTSLFELLDDSARASIMPPPASRRASTHAAWSAPARLPNPAATRGHPERRALREPIASGDRKLPILAANFVLFLLYVVSLLVLSSERESILRVLIPIAIGILGVATFAPLALALTRRGRPSDRRRS